MKKTYIVFALVLAIMSACYDDKDPVAEIITPTGKGYYPTSANTLTDLVNGATISANRAYKPNDSLAFEIIYWSVDPVKEVNLYATVGTGAKEIVFHGPYGEIAAFSSIKSADTVLLDYRLPMVGATTPVKLEIEIVNENTLSLTRSITIQAKP